MPVLNSSAASVVAALRSTWPTSSARCRSAAICAFAVYGLGMPIAYLVSLGQVLVVRPPSLADPRWWPAPAEDADPAVLQYFYGPARADAEHAVRVAYANCRGLWQFGRGCCPVVLRY